MILNQLLDNYLEFDFISDIFYFILIMKTQKRFHLKNIVRNCFIALFLFSIPNITVATSRQMTENQDSESYTVYKGIVVDQKSGSPIEFAELTIEGTTISIVTNKEGEFTLKVPDELSRAKLIVSYMGYKNKLVSVSSLRPKTSRIEMAQIPFQLREITVISKNAETLVRDVMAKKGENYLDEPTLMTGFFRESIKRNNNCVSLSEAVVDIYKQPYTTLQTDIVKIHKARKKTNYTKSDTLAFKLRGGPFNTLNLDIIKNPELFFTENMLSNYSFSMEGNTLIDNKLIYIVSFKPRQDIKDPAYAGKLFIDAQSLALKSAVFNLNIEDKVQASRMFVSKKPFNARLNPLEATYRIDYSEKDGKWYFHYSRIDLGFRVKWNRKLFDTNFYSTTEMAVIDWEPSNGIKPVSRKERLKPSVILADRPTGFTDPDFWGEYNIIEPDKSIKSAIDIMKNNIEKQKSNQFIAIDMKSK